MASKQIIDMAKEAITEVEQKLKDTKEFLDLAAEHQSDVRIGRYTIHRTKDQVFVQKGNGTFMLIDEDMLATAIGAAYEKNMAGRVGG